MNESTQEAPEQFLTGLEAMTAWYTGHAILVNFGTDSLWHDFEEDTDWRATIFKIKHYKFKLKSPPATITLDGVQLPKPCIPQDGDKVFYLDSRFERGYQSLIYREGQKVYTQYGVWHNENDAYRAAKTLQAAINRQATQTAILEEQQ